MSYTLDILTRNSASIKTINSDGVIHRKPYINTEKGRQEVIQELPEDIQNEIFLAWGDVSTIIEHKHIDTTQPPTIEERLQMAEDTILFMLIGGM